MKLSAIKIVQNDKEFYLFSCKASKLGALVKLIGDSRIRMRGISASCRLLASSN